MQKRQALFLVFTILLTAFIGIGTIQAGESPPPWTKTSNFVPPAGAMRATGNFNGTLHIATAQMTVTPTPEEAEPVVWGSYQYPWALWYGWGYPFEGLAAQDPPGAVPLFELDATLFPGLDIQFFTTKAGDLVPVERGIIRKPVKDRTKSFWELIVGPGKVWKDNKNKNNRWKGWNKAAFPFSLVQSQEGEALIGLAFFYYKGHQVSDLYYQVSNDTAGGFIFWDADFNMTAWGKTDMTFTPNTIPDLKKLHRGFRKEKAERLPMKPLVELGEAIEGIGGDVNRENVLTMALLVDGVLYYSPIHTPFGEYPYPYGMRVGVWSASKSLVPGMAALRLLNKYGPDFLDTTLIGYFDDEELPATLDDRWNDVTIWHALHMTTGMGPAGYGPNWDWTSENTYLWSYSYELADQIWYYFNQAANPEVGGPGEAFYYMDQDMWGAALAMQRFIQGVQTDPQATLLNLLLDEVYKPIGVGHFASGTGYTESGEAGFPFSAWGVLPTIDYLAKAGRLIANHGRTEEGEQILDRDIVEMLFDNPNYQFAFWKTVFTNGEGETFYIPTMSGAGGNYVFCMPNGMVGVVLGYNSYNFGWSEEQKLTVVEAANKLLPF